MAKHPKKPKEKKPAKTREVLPPPVIAGNDTTSLKDDLLYLVKLAITLAKDEPDITRYTAVARSLTSLKTATDLLLKDTTQRVDVTCSSAATIALIEEEILGIKRTVSTDEGG